MWRPLFRKTALRLSELRGVAGVSTLSRPAGSFLKIKKSRWHRAFSSACGDLSGTWYNQSGSMMQIIQSENGELIGCYHNCAPGSTPAKEKLSGSVGKEEHASQFGFTVNFLDGWFTTSWTGQYIKEGDADSEEVLVANWIMTPNLQDGVQHLESIHVGQDRFTRKLQNPERLPSFDDSEPKGWLLAY